jgi:TRAP-type C4-dicarboxylate transport system permease large subunit
MSSMLLYIITNAVLFSFLMTSEQIPSRINNQKFSAVKSAIVNRKSSSSTTAASA